MKFPTFLTVWVVCVSVLLTGSEATAKQRGLIRDAEIENIIRDYATPLFEAAGLIADDVNIYIVNDNSLNAFVMGGQNLFMNTGLIMRSDTAGQVIGVIAHEAGHIAGGHLARLRGAVEDARTTSLISTILGAAVAIGSGRGDVGAAIMQSGSAAGVGGLMKFSRTQESAADHAGLSFLDQAGISSEGLLQFMDKLADQELLYESRQSPYLRTHPMSRNRYRTVAAHLKTSPATGTPLTERTVVAYGRMKAKLHAFTEPFSRTLRRYPETDTSLFARYARAVAYYRKPALAEAIKRIDGLIADHPRDPYFHELKGQALFENGKVKNAIGSYRRAVNLMPASSLLRRDLGRALIESDDNTLLPEAIQHLTIAVNRDPADTFSWRQLAIAHGRLGQNALSSLALAEESVRKGRKQAALHHAGKAQQTFPRGTKEWLHAQDIIEAANLMNPK